MIKYVLWDLDGTIVESEDVRFKTDMFRYASKKYGLVFDLQAEEFIGHEGKSVFKLLLMKNNIVGEDAPRYWSFYNDWYEEAVSYIKENVKDIKPRENVIELWNLISNAGFKNAVVTSSREDVAQAYLKNIGLYEKCSLLTCLNHVSNPKPNPEPYLMAMEKLKTTPKDCIAIEDSYSGIASAKDAQLYTIAWVKDVENSNYLRADVIVSALTFAAINTAFSI